MAGWKKLKLLSDEAARQREAAFEAEMLALVAAPAAPAAAPGPTAPSIEIKVTRDGQTTVYPNLEAVPVDLRQYITQAWQSRPGPRAVP